MDKVVFYGAGNNAKENIEDWIKEGWIPECIVDRDEKKWGGVWDTSAGRIEVMSLDKANQLYPQAQIKITLARKNLKEATEYLLEQGIEKERISYFEPVEYRLGCDELGKVYMVWRDTIGTCCVPGYFHVGVPAGDNIEENYRLYKAYFGALTDSMRNGDPGVCKGCRNLKFDIFDMEQDIEEITIASNRGKDFCNAKCFYCEQYPMPSETARTHRKEEIMKEVHYFKTHYPDTDFFFEIEAGDISVANYRSELLNFLIDNNYGACIRTNAFVYCAEVANLLELGKSYLWVTLDSTKPEIYKKCKGSPSVDVVKDNLREYAKHGPVYLKWIALENIYVSFDDVKGIIDFASEIHSPRVIVSADTNNITKPSSEELLELVKEFIVYAKKKSVPTYILYNQFHEQTATEIQEFELEIQEW
jgi:hypothetical protein